MVGIQCPRVLRSLSFVSGQATKTLLLQKRCFFFWDLGNSLEMSSKWFILSVLSLILGAIMAVISSVSSFERTQPCCSLISYTTSLASKEILLLCCLSFMPPMPPLAFPYWTMITNFPLHQHHSVHHKLKKKKLRCQGTSSENKEKNGRADVELGLHRVRFQYNWDHTPHVQFWHIR